MRFIFLFILTLSYSSSFAQILRGHLIDGNKDKPIPNAEIYISGGDRENKTTPIGEYRLDLSIGRSISYGDEVVVYINHEEYGLMKKRILIPRSLEYDIVLSSNRMMRITGRVQDESSRQPIEGIIVEMILEEGSSDEAKISTTTDRNGGYSFRIDKNILGNQRYCPMFFYDPSKKYDIVDKPINVLSFQRVYLKSNYNSSEDNSTIGGNDYKTPVKLSPISTNNSSYKTVSFDGIRGVRRNEFRISPNENSSASTIADGDKVKIIGSIKKDNIEWSQVVYKGKNGWIKSEFIQ